MRSFLKKIKSDPLFPLFMGPKCRHLLTLLFVLIPSALAALLEGLSFGLILLAFSVLNGEKLSSFSVYTSLTPYLPVAWLEQLSSQGLFILCVIAAILFQALRSATSFVGQYWTIALATRIQASAQAKVYEQILSLSFPCVSRYKVGDLIEYARTPVTLIGSVMDVLSRLLVSGFMIIVSIVVLWLLSPLLTVIAFTLFLLVACSQKFLFRKMASESKRLTDLIVDFSKHTIQSLHGLRSIYTNNRQSDVYNTILITLDRIARTGRKINLWNNSFISLNEIMGIILVGLCLIAGGFLLKDGGKLLPVLLTFISVTYRLNTRVQIALNALGSLASNLASFRRLREILSREDKEFAPIGGKAFTEIKRHIEFKDVVLQYAGQSQRAVNRFSFVLPQGKVTAFVGASGAGKSSLIDLLVRLYEPTSGHIEIDGTPLQNYDVGSWRNALGVVSQDTFIFNDSIEDNIRFGLLKASEKEVVEAAKAAQAHEFIARLPEKYNTLLGERGYRLSGGERQRIALARALLRKPQVLILDEATSNLDSQSESLIQDALEKFQEERTVIIIAHRLSTIVKADCILVLENGQLIEQGTHHELLEKEGHYAHYWKLQAQHFSRITPEVLATV